MPVPACAVQLSCSAVAGDTTLKQTGTAPQQIALTQPPTFQKPASSAARVHAAAERSAGRSPPATGRASRHPCRQAKARLDAPERVRSASTTRQSASGGADWAGPFASSRGIASAAHACTLCDWRACNPSWPRARGRVGVSSCGRRSIRLPASPISASGHPLHHVLTVKHQALTGHRCSTAVSWPR